MGRTRKVTIEVELPEEIAGLVERVPWLRRVIAEEGVEGLRRRLELQARLDLLTPETGLTEEEIMELDRILKRALARRLEDELSKDSG
ncbi:MAG: hypothetical protein GSR80_000760 [Desulfurococcales archaeon]|nr:hypothetical protein [Desulfurococcales archaeon]